MPRTLAVDHETARVLLGINGAADEEEERCCPEYSDD